MAGRNFILESSHGILIFAKHHKEICGFQKFIQAVNPSMYPEDNFLTLFWYEHFHCSVADSDCTLENCTPNASLVWLPGNRFDMTMRDDSYNIYNAVYAVAHTLREMLLEQVQMQSMVHGKGVQISPWQVMYHSVGCYAACLRRSIGAQGKYLRYYL